MTFVPRNYVDLTSAMVAWLGSNPDAKDGVTPSDLTVGSLERAHLEAVAILMEEYDQRAADAIKAAIPESCFYAFGFSKLPPVASTTTLVCSSFVAVPYNVTIPIGTTFQGPNGVLFLSTTTGTILSGQTVSDNISAKATVTGITGNVAENTISRIVTPIQYLDTVTNPQAALGGAEEEGDDSRALRFQAYLRTLVRGTKEALEFAAMSVPSQTVLDARAIEPFLLDPVPDGVPYAGKVWLFVDDGTLSTTLGTTTETEVYNAVNGYIDPSGTKVPGYKAAGVIVDILKSTPVPVCVRAQVKLASGAVARWVDIQASLTAAMNAYFSNLRISEVASYQNLVTTLTTCDADIREVNLVFWKASGTVPDYAAAIMASDITPIDSSTPLSLGWRLRPLQDVSAGVTYPEWILA
jgi:hypothetical protein